MIRHFLFMFLAACCSFTASGCAPTPEPPPLCNGIADKCVVPGLSSAGICDEEGQCVGTNDSCNTDRDCFAVIAAGTELPTWDRPQGGLGTRLNLRVEGFPSTTQFSSLQTIILGSRQENSGAVGPDDSSVPCDLMQCGTTPEECPCDATAGFTCIALPNEGSICAEVICNQVNRRFPLELETFDALVVPELPVRFQNDFGLEDLDNREVMLHMSVTTHAGEEVAASVLTKLSVGDFIKPSWWEE